jgi:pyruvate kinase
MGRRTKIIATLGPATDDRASIDALVAAGLDVARLNFSHGDHDVHRRRFDQVREASEAAGRPVAILQDIQGPKIRLGSFPDGGLEVATGDEVRVVSSESAGTGAVPVVYDGLLDDVRAGERVVLADGLVRLRVEDVTDTCLVCVVEIPGRLSDKKGAAFPDSELSVPAITAKDEVDLAFGQELGVDYVAASFVRTGDDVRRVKELAGGVPVIAKIELAAAYDNLDDILEAADGAMVARGDLGVQLPLETIPVVQEDILRRTNRAGKLSITATEMLESMTHSPRPTRAEVTDVANAITTGTDAVMLSGETAVGDYPLRVVETMARICEETDRHSTHANVEYLTGMSPFASATARAAVEIATDMGLSTIVAFTESGTTARLLSKYRPDAQVVAFTAVPAVYRRMALYRGVLPQPFERRDTTDLMLASAEKYLEKEGLADVDEVVVMVAGIPPNVQASTNLVKLHVIGERSRRHGQQLSAPE